MTNTTSLRRVVAAIGAATLALSGCSIAAETTTTTTAPATPESVEVTALDYAYTGIPTEVKAVTSFTLVNNSDTELHEFVVVRLADDDTRSERMVKSQVGTGF